LPDTRLKRYRLRLNADYEFSEKFNTSFDIAGSYSLISEPHSTSFALSQIWRTPPMNPHKTPGNRPAELILGSENPWVISQKKYAGENNISTQFVLMNFRTRYSPINNFNVEFSFAPRINFNNSKDFQNVTEYYDIEEIVTRTKPQLRTINMNKNYSINNDIKLLLNYSNNYHAHDFIILGGFQQITNYYEYLTGYREGSQFSFDQINAFPVSNQVVNGSANEWALQSYFGRINYSYLNRYLFEANIRYDGSSRFAKGYRWGLF